MPSILVSDPTLRDGNHAVQHRLTAEQIICYAQAADAAGIPIIEVGHGNGLGASSLQVGEMRISDEVVIRTARAHVRHAKLGVHVIPGFATVERDLRQAIDWGVDVFRIASHCTEADLTERHIRYLRHQDKTVYGVLMMSHMADLAVLLQECLKLEAYGAQGVILMDSAGAYLPSDVIERIALLVHHLSVPIGFHAHNNLGLAIANSIAAVQAGATMVDGTVRGFGAGAGNAPLEVLVAVLHKMGYQTGIDLYRLLDAADLAQARLMETIPTIQSTSLVSGLAGVFSGFSKHVERIAASYHVDPRDVFFELGRRKAVAGQEDLILQVAMELASKN